MSEEPTSDSKTKEAPEETKEAPSELKESSNEQQEDEAIVAPEEGHVSSVEEGTSEDQEVAKVQRDQESEMNEGEINIEQDESQLPKETTVEVEGGTSERIEEPQDQQNVVDSSVEPAEETSSEKPDSEDKPVEETNSEQPDDGDKPVEETSSGQPDGGDKPVEETSSKQPDGGDKQVEKTSSEQPDDGDDQPSAGEEERVAAVESLPPEQHSEEMDTRASSTLPVQPLEDIAEEDEPPEVDREALEVEVKKALAENEQLVRANNQLQHKIVDYLPKKKERADPGRSVTDQEKRYDQCMAALERYDVEMQELEWKVQQEERSLQELKEYKESEVQTAKEMFVEYRRERALTAVHSRTGKRLTTQDIDQFQVMEDSKEAGVIQVRKENIKLQNKIAKQEAQIKQKEQLAEGLHMIDFEQLKINNVDLNEKIEERNEDIQKLRKKVTSTVQVLTHVKEKLQFLQAENADKKNSLREIEAVVAKKRDHLTRMKQARDALRMDNIRLRQRGGLVGHPALLRDFEDRREQSVELKRKLEHLQKRHSELTVMCDGLRKKIEQARNINPHF